MGVSWLAMGNAKLPLALLLATLFGLSSRAEASSFTVNPIKISLSGREQSALLSLLNQSDEEVRFKIAPQEWKQSPKGEMQLHDTKDIVVFPTLLTLGPKQERKLRVGSTVSPGESERSYRIFVEELPPLRSPKTESQSQVRVLTKMGIPIFIEPGKPAVAGAVERLGVAKRILGFAVKNTGNVHFLVQSVRVKALDAAGGTTFEKKLDGWYVLAGGIREWEVEIPKDACAKTKGFAVDVQAAETKFNSRLVMPAAGCGP
jgi:fimbrial chaperone protein